MSNGVKSNLYKAGDGSQASGVRISPRSWNLEPGTWNLEPGTYY